MSTWRLLLKGLLASLLVGGGLVLLHPLDLSQPPEPPAALAEDAPARLPPTPTRPPLRVGLVAGHSGTDDPGAVCPDGVTEVQVNTNIVREAARVLREAGFQVDILEEFDARLQGYRALALVSVHADSCSLAPDLSGFKLAISAFLEQLGDARQQLRARRLQGCLEAWYAAVTDLEYHPETVTRDMREYHAFREVHPDTPAVIIETGFLGGDYDLLVNRPQIPGRGVAMGVLCFARSENLPVPFPSLETEE